MSTVLLECNALPHDGTVELTRGNGLYYVDEWDDKYLIFHESFVLEEAAREAYFRRLHQANSSA